MPLQKFNYLLCPTVFLTTFFPVSKVNDKNPHFITPKLIVGIEVDQMLRLFKTVLMVSCSFLILMSCTSKELQQDVDIVAHRGAMSEKPENTLAAFQHALDLGADIIEIDLWTSSDGHLFILHDPTLNRTTNGTGIATEYTLDTLQSLDAGKWFDESYEGLKIPSFIEVLEWSKQQEATLLLDLKEQGRVFAERVAADVKSNDMEKSVVVGVRSVEQAGIFRELLPDSKQLAFMRHPDLIEAFSKAGVDVLRLWLRWLDEDPTLAERVHTTGKKLMINGTAGGLEETRTILSFSPDWILIDDVHQLRKSLTELK